MGPTRVSRQSFRALDVVVDVIYFEGDLVVLTLLTLIKTISLHASMYSVVNNHSLMHYRSRNFRVEKLDCEIDHLGQLTDV